MAGRNKIGLKLWRWPNIFFELLNRQVMVLCHSLIIKNPTVLVNGGNVQESHLSLICFEGQRRRLAHAQSGCPE